MGLHSIYGNPGNQESSFQMITVPGYTLKSDLEDPDTIIIIVFIFIIVVNFIIVANSFITFDSLQRTLFHPTRQIFILFF